MKIQILGSGCPKCKQLHITVKNVIAKIKDIDIKLEYSDDIKKIIETGAMSSPVFLIDKEIITSGKIPSEKEIKQYILDKFPSKDKLKV